MESEKDTCDRARALFANGMAVEALELLAFQLADKPHDARILELKGIIHHAMQEYEFGRAAIESAELIRPLSAPAQLALADCYSCTHRPDLARQTYVKLASRRDVPFDLLSGLAMGLARLKQFALALQVCRQGFERNPACHHARYGVAFYMSKCGYPPELIYPLLRRVVEMAPNVFHYRMAAATMLCQMKQFDRAYLAIADATPGELYTVRCRCCLERLSRLYKSASDRSRAVLCIRRLTTAESEC